MLSFAVNNLKRGFTIVELLIVVVVIAILAAITLVSYNGISSRAENSAALTEFNHVKKAVAIYRAENGEFPVCERPSDAQPGWNYGWGCGWAGVSNAMPGIKSSRIRSYVSTNGHQGGWAVIIKKGNISCKAGENMQASWWVSYEACWP